MISAIRTPMQHVDRVGACHVDYARSRERHTYLLTLQIMAPFLSFMSSMCSSP